MFSGRQIQSLSATQPLPARATIRKGAFGAMKGLLKASWIKVIVAAFMVMSMAWPAGVLPAGAAEPQHPKVHPLLQELADKNPK